MLDDQQARDFRVDQIKEKYAGLRVYWSLGRQKTTVIEVVAPDSIVRIQEAPNSRSAVFDQISARVKVAEEEASRTCQRCGSSGAERCSKGWLVTLCEACAAARVKD